MRILIISLFVLCIHVAGLNQVIAQTEHGLQGYWMGNLKTDTGEEIRIAFNILKNQDNNYTASLDVPDQGARGIPVDRIEVNNSKVMLYISAARATFEGTFSHEENSIDGYFIQGDSITLVLEPVDLETIEGIWIGPLKVASGDELRILFEIYIEDEGNYTVKFGSPDQGAMGIPAEKAEFSDGQITLDLSNFDIKYLGTVADDPLSMTGSFIQGDTLKLDLQRYNQMPDLSRVKKEVERPQKPQGPYPYDEEAVVYENTDADVRLTGILTLPHSDKPSSAVILIHGSGRNDRNGTHLGTFHLLADYLTRRGIAVLRYDKRGVGESTGDYGQSTTHDFAEDVEAGVAFLKNHDRIDPELIGLIGHSEGGLIAPMIAASSEEIAFIVIMAGLGQTFGEAAGYMRTDNAIINGATEQEAKVLRSWYNHYYEIVSQESDTLIRENKVRQAYSLLQEDEKGIIGWSDESITREVKATHWIWFQEAFKLDPQEYFRNVICPVLALTGEKDRQANPKENLPLIEKALKESKSKDYMVEELPGLNHLFQTAKTGMVSEYDQIAEIIAPLALQMIGDWITARTGN